MHSNFIGLEAINGYGLCLQGFRAIDFASNPNGYRLEDWIQTTSSTCFPNMSVSNLLLCMHSKNVGLEAINGHGKCLHGFRGIDLEGNPNGYRLEDCIYTAGSTCFPNMRVDLTYS